MGNWRGALSQNNSSEVVRVRLDPGAPWKVQSESWRLGLEYNVGSIRVVSRDQALVARLAQTSGLQSQIWQRWRIAPPAQSGFKQHGFSNHSTWNRDGHGREQLPAEWTGPYKRSDECVRRRAQSSVCPKSGAVPQPWKCDQRSSSFLRWQLLEGAVRKRWGGSKGRVWNKRWGM